MIINVIIQKLDVFSQDGHPCFDGQCCNQFNKRWTNIKTCHRYSGELIKPMIINAIILKWDIFSPVGQPRFEGQC
jgi:hypothetical protein